MNHRRSLITELVLEKLLIVVVFALIPALANALVVTLEPDDYGMNVPLQNEYVSVGTTEGKPASSPVITPVTAKNSSAWDEDYEAPTGNLTFGNYGYMPPYASSGMEADWAGMVFSFNQAVSQITLLANTGYKDSPYDSSVWVAFDGDGNVIQNGKAGAPAGQHHLPYLIDIPLENARQVIVGGEGSFPYIYFDHLTFEIPD